MSEHPKSSAFRDLQQLLANKKPAVGWIGAGLSASVGLPTWPQLRDILIGRLREQIAAVPSITLKKRMNDHLAAATSSATLWHSFEELRHGLGSTEFAAAIQHSLSRGGTGNIPSSLLSLWTLKLEGLLTLNLDMLASRAFSQCNPGGNSVVISARDLGRRASILRDGVPYVVHLHGQVSDPSSWVMANAELISLLKDDAYTLFIRTVVLSRTIVFVGITATDVAVGGHLDRLRSLNIKTSAHYWITDNTDASSYQWAQDNNIRVIYYDRNGLTAPTLDRLLSALIEEPATDAPPLPVPPSKAVFPAPPLPDAGTLARDDPERVRMVLNAHAVELLSPVQDNSDEESVRAAIDEYAAFLKKYDEAIARAWYIPAHEPHGRFLDYALDSVVGEGGFASVYRASSADGSSVAVKVLRDNIRSNKKKFEAFRRGVASNKLLTEAGVPGMVKYYGAWEIPACVVMEFIEGVTLLTAVEKRLIDDWERVLEVCSQLARIVAAAHALPRQVVHRDIRPHNVMLENMWNDRDEICVRLLDFDLSWYRDAFGQSFRDSSTISGFIAPEQVEDVPEHDSRSTLVDSFGIGMTMYYARTGAPVYYGDHRRLDWISRIFDGVESHAHARWRSLPRRFARLVVLATADVQSMRCTVNRIVAELDRLVAAAKSPLTVRSPDLLLEEILCRTGWKNKYEWDGVGMSAHIEVTSGCRVRLHADSQSAEIRFHLSWSDTGNMQRRNIVDFMETWTNRAKALLTQSGWVRAKAVTQGRAFSLEAAISVETLAVALDKVASGLTEAIMQADR